MHMTIRCLT